ncbi:hypothetical protein KLEP181_gp50 [Paracoccus phage vB_PmaP_KLEP18-1]|nr:hypothetical protein KLEP181_gp50 [Paracoccus phage vB_PmaP_KLEP18-1]
MKICLDCGLLHGNRPPGVPRWHPGICAICEKPELLTDPVYFGGLKETARTE